MSHYLVRQNLVLCALLLGNTLLYRDELSATKLPAVDSCSGKCGVIQQLPCSCDMKCVVYNNCCEDFSSECPHVEAASRDVYRKQLLAKVECVNRAFTITTCVLESGDVNTTLTTTAQNVSKDSNMSSFNSNQHTGPEESGSYTQSKLLDVLRDAQVTDRATGFVYLNIDVFQCFATNNSDPVLWDTQFAMHVIRNPISLNIFSQHVDNYISPRYVPPPKFQEASCIHKDDTPFLKESCDNVNLNTTIAQGWSRKCGQFFSYVIMQPTSRESSYIHKNIYCAFCHVGTADKLEPMTNMHLARHVSAFSVMASLSDNKIQLVYGSSMGLPLLWHEAVCNVTNLPSLDETGCSVLSCHAGYFKMPSGQCRHLRVLYFAIPKDEFGMQEAQFRYFPSFFLCYFNEIFEYVDRVNKPSKPFIVLDKDIDQILYSFSFRLFVDSLTEIMSELAYREIYRELLTVAQIYMYYRKSVFDSPDSNSTFLRIDEHVTYPVRVIPYLSNRYETNVTVNMTGRGDQSRTVTVCLCRGVTRHWDPSGCIFECISQEVNTSESSAIANLSTDRCYLQYKHLVDTAVSGTGDLRSFKREKRGLLTTLCIFFTICWITHL